MPLIDYMELDIMDKIGLVRYCLCPSLIPIAKSVGLGHREATKAPFELEYHSCRVATLTAQVIKDSDKIPKEMKSDIFDASLLHDVGKGKEKVVGKWGAGRKLSRQEYEENKEHSSKKAIVGVIRDIMGIDPDTYPSLNMAVGVGHHLRIDKTGYPKDFDQLSEILGFEVDDDTKQIIQLIGVIDAIEAMSSDLRRHNIKAETSAKQGVEWWKLTNKEKSDFYTAITTVEREAEMGAFDVELVKFVAHSLMPDQPKDALFLPEMLGDHFYSTM